MKKRFMMALVAGGLLAAMLPVVATAQQGSSASVVLVPDYVWDGRLAGTDPAIEYDWNGRLAGTSPAIDYVWNGRLAGSPSLELALTN